MAKKKKDDFLGKKATRERDRKEYSERLKRASEGHYMLDKEGRPVTGSAMEDERRLALAKKRYEEHQAGGSKLPPPRTPKKKSEGKKKMRHGGLVENGHDVTEARGSGAARPQKFRKDG